MKRFFLDARKLGDGGIGTFIESLIDGALDYQDQEVVLDVIVTGSYLKSQGLPRHWEGRSKLNFYEDNTKRYSLSEYFYLPKKWGSLINKSDLYVSPHYTLPFGINVPSLVVIHDMIQVQFPDTLIHKVIPKILISSAIKRASLIATVSNHSKKILAENFPIGPDKIKIIPNSIRKDFIKSEIQSQNYFLYVGADRIHKRLDICIEFLSQLKHAGVSTKAVFVSNLSEASRNLISESNLETDIIVKENLRLDELVELYRNATALMCASLEEGFCLPILEAMAMGKLVICPDLGYARELIGNNAIYYQPASPTSMFYSYIKSLEEEASREQALRLAREKALTFTPLNQFKALVSCV